MGEAHAEVNLARELLYILIAGRFSFRFFAHIFHKCEYVQKSRSRVTFQATSAILHLKTPSL